jgi:two-component system, chemotaxis family, chemotaxis protein CheY
VFFLGKTQKDSKDLVQRQRGVLFCQFNCQQSLAIIANYKLSIIMHSTLKETGIKGHLSMAVNKNMNILIVDDYKTMLRIIRNLLNQIGFDKIDEAMDGKEAFTKLRDKEYQLVISDWNMEPMSGYELLKSVRADEKLKALPFILVTAESKTENVIAAKKAGVNNYIVKPFNAETLKTKLMAVLGPF